MKTFLDGRRFRGAKFLMAVVVWGAFFAAVVWLVMLLWNWLMPALFVGARLIDYWQALGLLVLSKILFGGGHGRWRGRQRWDSMSTDEREQMKRQFRSRWGGRWGRSCGVRSAEGAPSGESQAGAGEPGPRDPARQGDR